MFCWKFARFLMSFLKAQVSFPSNVVSKFSAVKQNSSILFLAQTLYIFFKTKSLKCKFFRFLSALAKTCQIPHVNFELLSQFLFKYCIILHCHDTKIHVNFKLMHFLLWIKGPRTCSGGNLLNSSCHFWKHNSVFLQMLHQSSVPSSETPLHSF